jgi:hypothetical protein
MKALLVATLALLIAIPAFGQGFSINPNIGGTAVTKDGETTRIGEVLADIAYQFPWSSGEDPRWWGELCILYGLGDEGNQAGGLGLRTYGKQGTVYPGFGIQGFIVDEGLGGIVAKTSITVAPELLLEIPWLDESGQEKRITGYAAVYFPVSGDKDFIMTRFGIRTGI